MSTSSIESKIERARVLFDSRGAGVLTERHFQELLRDYQSAIRNTQQLMMETGVVALCSACATREHGSCCAREVENWYDDELLFINLLLGVRLDFTRQDAESCLFVGSRGCRLIARHYFCVNFLCPAISQSLGNAAAQRLQCMGGTELFAGWTLERDLRRWLNNKKETA